MGKCVGELQKLDWRILGQHVLQNEALCPTPSPEKSKYQNTKEGI